MFVIQLLNRKLILLIFIITANAALASEQQVLIDSDLIAIHNNGAMINSDKAPRAAVLMIHGWASQMNEVGDMYLLLAEQLADQEYASLRINIRG